MSPGKGEDQLEQRRSQIERCRQTVYRVLLRYCGNPADAEDMTQEALVKSLQNAAGYRGEARICTWVVTIATYVYLTHARKRVPPLTGVLQNADIPEPHTTVGGIVHEKDPHQRAEESERRRKLEEAIAKLPKEDALVLSLYHFDEYGYEELGALLEKSPTAVKMQVSRARRKLKATVEQMGCAELFEGI